MKIKNIFETTSETNIKKWKIPRIWRRTLQGTNISPKNGIFEDDFPFPKVGYVNSLEGIYEKNQV